MKKLREIKGNELYYNGFNLKELAKKYGTPLKITFLDVIKEHILSLKESFDKAIKKTGYNGKFIYLNANKANYGKEEIEEAFKYADGLETSSYYDLLLTFKFFQKYPEFKDKYLVPNGYKPKEYIDEIIKINGLGYNITDIIDSVNEYEYLKAKNIKMNVGLRIHVKALYTEEGDVIENDRFGLMPEEIDYILEDIKNTNLKLTTIHFHQRGFDYEKDKFEENFLKVLNVYAKAAKMYDTVSYFDIGGGMPLPIEEGFNYEEFATYIFETLKKLSKEFGIKEPNIISENGKFSQKDSTVNIYKVIGIKNTDNYPWNIVDGSLLIALPEMYALGEPILVMPINEIGKNEYKARLAGVTCDCDDVYYLKDRGYIELPKTDELYIGLIGTGSYQNSMNGKGGVHHCLLPEEKDIIIYEENGVYIEKTRHELQTIDDICKIINFK